MFELAWCTSVAAEDAAFTRVTHVYARPCSMAPLFLHKDQFLEAPCEMRFIARFVDQWQVAVASGRTPCCYVVTQHLQTFPARRCYQTSIGAPRARLAVWRHSAPHPAEDDSVNLMAAINVRFCGIACDVYLLGRACKCCGPHTACSKINAACTARSRGRVRNDMIRYVQILTDCSSLCNCLMFL